MLPEQRLRNKVVTYLKSKGIWHFVYPASSTYGLPDIIGIINGFFVGIELKREDGLGRPTLLQEETQKSIINAGGKSIISDSLLSIMEFVEAIEKER